MMANKNCNVVAFDICQHKYTPPCYCYLSSIFPGRIILIEGDSRETLPQYINSSSLRFDLIHIDGGHTKEIVERDYVNCLKLAQPEAIILMDDTHLPNIHDFWIGKIAIGEIEPLELLPTAIAPH